MHLKSDSKIMCCFSDMCSTFSQLSLYKYKENLYLFFRSFNQERCHHKPCTFKVVIFNRLVSSTLLRSGTHYIPGLNIPNPPASCHRESGKPAIEERVHLNLWTHSHQTLSTNHSVFLIRFYVPWHSLSTFQCFPAILFRLETYSVLFLWLIAHSYLLYPCFIQSPLIWAPPSLWDGEKSHCQSHIWKNFE